MKRNKAYFSGSIFVDTTLSIVNCWKADERTVYKS